MSLWLKSYTKDVRKKLIKKLSEKTETLWRTNYCLAGYLFLVIFQKLGCVVKGHSFCKKCPHDLQFKKTRYSSPNLSKLARADISCQFKKTRHLCRHCLQNEWTLGKNKLISFFSQKTILPISTAVNYEGLG